MRHVSPLWLAILLAAAFACLPRLVHAQASSVDTTFVAPVVYAPRLGGGGFGSALDTPVQHVADGNPGALPEQTAVGIALRYDVPSKYRYNASAQIGNAVYYVQKLQWAATPLPSSAGAVWARGPLRVAAGYIRPIDAQFTNYAEGESGRSVQEVREHRAVVAAAYTLDVPSVGRLSPGVRVGGARVDQVYQSKQTVSTYTSQATLYGLHWAAGAVFEPLRLPMRFGVQVIGPTTLRGDYETTCTNTTYCGLVVGESDLFAQMPARVEGSVGIRSGALSVDGTFTRIFWSILNTARLEDYFVDANEASVNVRYQATPRVRLAAGLYQMNRTPFSEEVHRYLPNLHTPATWLLLGVTYAYGPIVAEASYVNGGLLSGRAGDTHLGSLGVGYRF